MAFAATEHELLSIIANECYALAWILGSGAEVAESNISRAFNIMQAFGSRYTDQVSTLISAASAEIYNMKGGIVEILCGKAICDRLVHMRLALFLRADSTSPLSKVRSSTRLRFASELFVRPSEHSQTHFTGV